MPSQSQKAETFRDLHAGGSTFVIPNPCDAGSARLFAGMGFEALASTSSGFAMTLGRSDYKVSLDEKLAHLENLATSVDVPVTADLEDGFADTADGVAMSLAMAAQTGIVGCSIEDVSRDANAPILPFDEAVARVTAAVQAARSLPFPFMLTARAENLLHGRDDLDDTIRRLQAFEAAGADVLYAPGLRSMDQVRAIVRSVTKPVNVLGVMVRDGSVDEMTQAGVCRISMGGAMARASAGEAIRAARELLDTGTYAFMGRAAGGELARYMNAGTAQTH